LAVWLNNPNDISTQNAIRTSVNRLWLSPVINVDPDVMFFRSKYNTLKPHEQQLLQDAGLISGFKATSDLPQWMTAKEREALRQFLEANPRIDRLERHKYRIDGRVVDFSSVIPIQTSAKNIPIWLAKNLGLLKMGIYQALPAIWENIRA
jgi:alpha-galactosidase